MKLIKINTDHYVVVDDSEIKEGDWFYSPATKEALYASKDMLSWNNDTSQEHKGWQKITHSTQPLESLKIDSDVANIRYVSWGDIKYLPFQEVKELIGEVDVEKKAEKFIGCEYEDIEDNIDQIGYDSFIRGYNQALEDNKEKKYTEEDLRKAIQLAWEADSIDGTVDLNIVLHYGDNNDLRTKWSEDEIIQSFQPKTEWEVEFDENNKLKLK